MPNFSSLARLEVPEKFVWWVGGVCKVIFMSNPTVVLCCVGVGVLTKFTSSVSNSEIFTFCLFTVTLGFPTLYLKYVETSLSFP